MTPRPYQPYRNSQPKSRIYDPGMRPYDPAPASRHTASTFTQRIDPLPAYKRFRTVPVVPPYQPASKDFESSTEYAPPIPKASVPRSRSRLRLGLIPVAFARLRKWVMRLWDRWG